ncbi:MAG: hypothetical protein IPO90_14620, partial [Flavobacteriales bacterium]|nr:hypothetical protein [Flavobacteriales bacterium]
MTDNDDPTSPARPTIRYRIIRHVRRVMPVAATATDNCAVDLDLQTAGPVAGDVLTLHRFALLRHLVRARNTTGNNNGCV